MACKKYTLTNTTNSNGVFSYQECSNQMWNYNILIEPNTTLNVWLITGTYNTASSSVISVDDLGDFPFVIPPTPSVSGTGNATPTPTPTPSLTPSNTPTISLTASLTATPTNTLTPTNTETPTNTPTSTNTETPTPTNTETPTNTPTVTSTPTTTTTLTPTPSATPPPPQGLFFTMKAVGPDVILSGIGTANLASLILDGPYSHGGTFITPNQGIFNVGTPASNGYYSGVTLSSPVLFGSGSITSADLSTGDVFGLNGFGAVSVPAGYSGGLLNGTATFTGTTFLTLGVTPGGPYLIQWGASGASETITLQVI